MTRPTDPPESLMAQWWREVSSEGPTFYSRHMAQKGAEYGYQQAMQDRAEIAALLRELAITSDHHAAHLQGQRFLSWAQQARDAAARARVIARAMAKQLEQS
jgi:hypothetical protein